MKSALEIFNQLNETDELSDIEAKQGTEISSSVMESVCAFSNEPNLGGGYILLGAIKDDSLFPQYIVNQVGNLDKIQSDFATQCATIFNFPIRPEIKVEQINEKNVVLIKVNELPQNQKPLYLKKIGLPEGAYRRIGPTDHRCTEDDMPLFYTDQRTYDQSPLDRTNIEDVDEVALKRYRDLRNKINPTAEELTFSDEELLLSLGCIEIEASNRLTVAGLLLFGQASSLRRTFPMTRVDYIRVPGNEWIEDPDERFSSIDMRGPLILLVFRVVDAIYSDLPKAFRLEDKDLQADSVGIPVKALREAITNSLMHRSYRVNAPIQVIRYDNRIEIQNPGFSLKSEERLGTPGSETRNPFIAAVFHETNLAETKGSGIRAMRKLLTAAHLAPPTFESDRDNNKFTVRLLLHHFLNEEDLKWLNNFDVFNLNDYQKQALIFVREVGAIDNNAYRQISDNDTLKASVELRQLRDFNLLEQKGKGRGTYYIPGNELTAEVLFNPAEIEVVRASNIEVNTEGIGVNTEGIGDNTEGIGDNTEGVGDNTVAEELLSKLPEHLRLRVKGLRKRETDVDKIKLLIRDICKEGSYDISQLAILLKRDENWISRTYVKPLIHEGKLNYTIPEMINHPEQAYRSTK